MTADERRLARLRRLERVRAAAKRQVAAETAQAEGVLAQLRALTERTRQLAADYVGRDDVPDGYMLTQSTRFAAGLCQIIHSTGREASTAQARADRKMAELAAAERSRAAGSRSSPRYISSHSSHAPLCRTRSMRAANSVASGR